MNPLILSAFMLVKVTAAKAPMTLPGKLGEISITMDIAGWQNGSLGWTEDLQSQNQETIRVYFRGIQSMGTGERTVEQTLWL